VVYEKVKTLDNPTKINNNIYFATVIKKLHDDLES